MFYWWNESGIPALFWCGCECACVHACVNVCMCVHTSTRVHMYFVLWFCFLPHCNLSCPVLRVKPWKGFIPAIQGPYHRATLPAQCPHLCVRKIFFPSSTRHHAYETNKRSIGSILGHYLDQKRLKQGLYRHPWDDISYVLPEHMSM